MDTAVNVCSLLQIFSSVLDPLLRSIQLAATQLDSSLDVAVYTLNCLSAIQSTVLLYQYADERIEMIKALVGGFIDFWQFLLCLPDYAKSCSYSQ